jgi:hypothetical protein
MKKLLLFCFLIPFLAMAQTDPPRVNLSNLPPFNGNFNGVKFVTVVNNLAKVSTYDSIFRPVVKYTDTAAMFAGYMRIGSYATTAQNALKLNITDTASMLTNYKHWLSGYLVATSTDKTNWNTAYGWGNHATAGYLTNTTGDARYPLTARFLDSITAVKGLIASGGISVDAIPTNGSNNPVSSDGTFDALALKVDKVTGKGLSTNDYTSAEQTKLAGIATGATANSSDATLLARANHTGTQTASTISDFSSTARGLFSGTGSISYNSTTGVFSYTAPTAVSAFTNDAGYLVSSDISGKADKASITGATKTKITYNSQGIVTAGADATTSDIAEGSNLYHTDARVLATALTGLSTSTSTAVTATDNILVAAGKLQAQVNTNTTNITTNTTNISSNTSSIAALPTASSTTTLTNKTLTSPAYTTQSLTDASTVTWNAANGTIATVTLAGNRTLSITNAVANTYYQLTITQDATGSRTLTWPTIKWKGGTAPTLTTAGGSYDIITLWYNGTNYYGNYGLDYK